MKRIKSLGEKSLGENRGRWDAGFRSPLLRFPSQPVAAKHQAVAQAACKQRSICVVNAVSTSIEHHQSTTKHQQSIRARKVEKQKQRKKRPNLFSRKLERRPCAQKVDKYKKQ